MEPKSRGRGGKTSGAGACDMSIEVKNICKRFGNFVALDNVDISINSGELLALLGP